jgi:hypothetical protein
VPSAPRRQFPGSRLRVLAAFCVVLGAAPSAARPSAAPLAVERLAGLEERARELGLAQTSQWRALLHYRSDTIGGGSTSLDDDPAFFRSGWGKTDPEAELAATLASLLDPQARVREEQHPRCAFPARLAWLSERLELDPQSLPAADCSAFETWRAGINAQGVTLVLTEAQMNRPSSMFGHTLLRVDQAPPDAEDKRRDLLAYAINFAAETGPDRGTLFAVKGLTGAYPGYFSVLPYYLKVREYADWESRDLWEYGLNLTQEEVDRLVMHLWELQGMYFDYWFFDENCSYELLGLIEVVRPELDLRGRFRGWAIPVDTAREVLREAGLAGEIRWRPSATTRLRAQLAALDAQERRLLGDLADGKADVDDPRLAALSEPRRAAVLTGAHDLLRTRADKENPERERSLALLTARSRIPVQGDLARQPQQPAVRPDQGHETARVRMGAGWRDGRFFLEGRARPAFHDLGDPEGGYLPGAQINFLDTAVRFYPDGDELDLHELTLIDVVSVAPRDEFFEPVSWRFRTGLTTRLLRGRERGELSSGKLFRTEAGTGLSRELAEGLIGYGFLEGALELSGKLQPGWGAGVGTRAGLLYGPDGSRWRAQLETEAMRFVAGDQHTRLSARLQQNWRVTRNTGIALEVGIHRDFHETWIESGVYWKRWF